jgi:hypothetical protein
MTATKTIDDNYVTSYYKFRTAMFWLTGAEADIDNYRWSDYLPEVIEVGRIIAYLDGRCGQFMPCQTHEELGEGFTIYTSRLLSHEGIDFDDSEFIVGTMYGLESTDQGKVVSTYDAYGTQIKVRGIDCLLDVLRWMERVARTRTEIKYHHWDGLDDFFYCG